LSSEFARQMPTVAMREVVTGLDGAIFSRFGPVKTELVKSLSSRGFDGAPVLDAVGTPIAFVPTPILEELAATSEHLTAATPGLWSKKIGAAPTVDELLRFTLDQPAGVVLDGDGLAIGFFTLSDLNRHPVRAALYPLFAELEAELAILIESRFSEPWEWLDLVRKDRRAALVGYWEIAKRDEVDIGPIAGAMLSELGNVIREHEGLRTELGFSSKKQWDKTFDGLNEQRHSIMHPVRPLVSGLDDLRKLIERLDRLSDLIGRVTTLTGRARGHRS